MLESCCSHSLSFFYTDETEGGNADLQWSWVKSITQYWDPFPNAGILVASLGLCEGISICLCQQQDQSSWALAKCN